MAKSGILGYRAWKVRYENGEPHLFAGGLVLEGHPAEEWTSATMTASCTSSLHSAPQATCKCGLHAWHELSGALTQLTSVSGDWVIGAVRSYGEPVLIHDAMSRAPESHILAFAALGPVHSKNLLTRLAARFDVPIVAYPRLEPMAQALANRVTRRELSANTYISDLAVGEGGSVALSALSVDEQRRCYLHANRAVDTSDLTSLDPDFRVDEPEKWKMYVRRTEAGFVVATKHVPYGIGWVATAANGEIERKRGNPAFSVPATRIFNPVTGAKVEGDAGAPAILARDNCWYLTCLLPNGVPVEVTQDSLSDDGASYVNRFHKRGVKLGETFYVLVNNHGIIDIHLNGYGLAGYDGEVLS